MTEAIESKSKSKAAPTAFEMPKFEMPKFDIPKIEMPAAFREFAENGVAQAKETYEKMKAAAEEATDVLEDTYSTATKGASDYGLKVIEAARVEHQCGVRLRHRAHDREVAVGNGRAVDRACAQAVRGADRAEQGTEPRWRRRSPPRRPSRSRSGVSKALQQGRLTAPVGASRSPTPIDDGKARARARAFACGGPLRRRASAARRLAQPLPKSRRCS